MSAPLEQSLRATSIQSTPMSAQSAAHALTFVRQRLSAFPKEYAEFYVVKNNKDCPQGSPRLFISHFSFLISHLRFTTSLPTKMACLPFWSTGTGLPSMFFSYSKVGMKVWVCPPSTRSMLREFLIM